MNIKNASDFKHGDQLLRLVVYQGLWVITNILLIFEILNKNTLQII